MADKKRLKTKNRRLLRQVIKKRGKITRREIDRLHNKGMEYSEINQFVRKNKIEIHQEVFSYLYDMT